MRSAPSRVFPAVATAFLLQFLAVGLALVEVVPAWRPVRDGLVFGLVVLSMILGVTTWARREQLGGPARWRRAAGGLLCLLLVGGGWLAIFLRTTDDFGLRSRRLVQAMELNNGSRELYVYEYEGVPDGFEGTVLMVRDGILPVMRHMVETRYHLAGIQQEGEFIRIDLKGAQEAPVLRCNLVTRECWQ